MSILPSIPAAGMAAADFRRVRCPGCPPFHRNARAGLWWISTISSEYENTGCTDSLRYHLLAPRRTARCIPTGLAGIIAAVFVAAGKMRARGRRLRFCEEFSVNASISEIDRSITKANCCRAC